MTTTTKPKSELKLLQERMSRAEDELVWAEDEVGRLERRIERLQEEIDEAEEEEASGGSEIMRFVRLLEPLKLSGGERDAVDRAPWGDETILPRLREIAGNHGIFP